MPSSSDVQEQMTRAADIESQLAALPSQRETTQTSRLRMQLCEVLSDVILTYPRYAYRHDVFSRLWRHCFYSRISELRSRMSKELRKKGPNLKKYKDSLQLFLKEAVVLYDYLIGKYEKKLLPTATQEDEDDENMSICTTATTTDGVVGGLCKIYLYMGDLQRYLTDYKKAELYYTKSSKVSPGRGNPYNQLAVVAQLKDPSAPLSCLSLYYYARALCASKDPFSTAGDNLARLFQTNRDQLEKQRSSYSAKVKKNNKMDSRVFLAQFVDLHFDFFQGVGSTNNTSEEDQISSMEALETKILSLSENFGTLLSESAFGDALICKMIAIEGFSVWNAIKSNNVPASRYAHSFVLHFGRVLANQLSLNFSKKKKASARILLPLVLLCDYVVSLRHQGDAAMDDNDDEPEFLLEAERLFWNNIANLATALLALRDSFGRRDSKNNGTLKEYERLRGFEPFLPFLAGCGIHADQLSPGEAVSALGLSKSQTQESISDKSSASSAENQIKIARFFVLVDNLADIGTPLALDAAREHYRCTLVEQSTPIDDKDDAAVMDDDDPVVESHTGSPAMSPDEPDANISLSSKRASDISDDVLMYKRSEGGSGPALLVPGALLLNAENGGPKNDVPTGLLETRNFLSSEDKSGDLLELPRAQLSPERPAPAGTRGTISVPMKDAPVQPSATSLGPSPVHPGVMPPPGFGGPLRTATLHPEPTLVANESFFPPSVPGIDLSRHLRPQVQPLPPLQSEPTVFDMLGASEIETSNPFMSSTVISAPAVSTTMTGQYGDGFSPTPRLFGSYGANHDGRDASFLSGVDDGSSLLGSSLLDTIMKSDESNHSRHHSQNPFLT